MNLASGPTISALVRRGLSPNLLMQQAPMATQVTPGSPNFNPMMVTPPNPPMPDRSPVAGLAHAFLHPPAPSPGAAMPPRGSNMAPREPAKVKTEAEAIVNALIKRLASLPGPADQNETPGLPPGSMPTNAMPPGAGGIL
jgi:hypothetical protein